MKPAAALEALALKGTWQDWTRADVARGLRAARALGWTLNRGAVRSGRGQRRSDDRLEGWYADPPHEPGRCLDRRGPGYDTQAEALAAIVARIGLA